MTTEQSEATESCQLGWRWHVTAFIVLLALGAFILWGVYQPAMRQRANQYMTRGDLFAQRGISLVEQPDSSEKEMITSLEERVLAVYTATKRFEQWQQMGLPPARSQREFFGMVDSFHSLKSVLPELEQNAQALLTHSHQADSFSYLLEGLSRTARAGANRLATFPDLSDVARIADYQVDCSYLAYAVFPRLLETGRHILSLYDRESCYDMAMMEYLDAIAFSRNWSAPRLRMAELYRQRDWPEFAMMECLKVIKLDPDSEDGRKAEELLASYDGKHPESDYFIGLSRLMKGDRVEGERRLRHFVDLHPTIPTAPKAWNLLSHMDRGYDPFIKHFLRDEIWI